MRRRSSFSFLFTVLLFILFYPRFATAKFGDNGIIINNLNSGNDDVSCLILQPDGKLVAVGPDGSGFALVRYANNGTLDTNFGTGGIVIDGSFNGETAAVLQPDGKLVVAGTNDNNFVLVRYTGNGSLDANFGINGKVTTSFGDGTTNVANSLILLPDGKVVVAGSHRSSGYTDYIMLVRYTNSGSLDANFGVNGIVTSSFTGSAMSLVDQPDGKLAVAGAGSAGANGIFELTRYNSDGSLDTSFGTNGITLTHFGAYTQDYPNSLILQPDGKLVVAGNSSYSERMFALARYNANGSPDTNFGVNGMVTTSIGGGIANASKLVLQPDGKLVAAGNVSISGCSYFILARYNSDGSLDANFGVNGIVKTSCGNASYPSADIRDLILQPDEKLLAAGSSWNSNYNADFTLVRYTNNGNLDTQNDLPFMTEIKPSHALAGQTITLGIRGWNLDDVIGVQLRTAGNSINGLNLTVSSTQITVRFSLPATPGLYDLYLASSSVNKTFTGVFNSLPPLTLPVQWRMTDLGKAGSPLTGLAGIAIGEADSSGQQAVFVANSDTRLYTYKYTDSWSITSLPQQTGFFQDVILADADQDGVYEVHGANSYPNVFQYRWTGNVWSGNSISAYSGPLASGSQTGGGLSALYAIQGNALGQIRQFNQNWNNSLVGSGNGTILCSVVGDANNDQSSEIYTANADHKLYQYRYFGTSWSLTTIVYTGNNNNMTSLAIGDLDKDGANELYGSNLDGRIYQFKWNGADWANQPINTTSLVANKIVISDGDNDGNEEIYAAGQDGHVYQFKLDGSKWQMTVVGQAGSALTALAVGDGDNSHQYKVYAVGADAHVYQFRAEGSTPTPSRQEVSGSEKRLKVLHSQINPLRGELARIQWYQFKDNPVKLTIYNLLGDKIANPPMAAIYQANQLYEVSWTGKTDHGTVVGSGIYILCLESGDYKAWTKIAVVK